MHAIWEKLEKREKASLVGVYAASLALVWTLGYGWGRSSSASSSMQTAGVSTQGSVEVIDLNQPPKPEAAPTESTAPTEPTPSAEVVVHVSGAVKRAGVYRLAPDSRVADAIEQAGGATEHADLDALNLAEPLQDGQKIHVPRKGEVSAAYRRKRRAVANASRRATSRCRHDAVPHQPQHRHRRATGSHSRHRSRAGAADYRVPPDARQVRVGRRTAGGAWDWREAAGEYAPVCDGQIRGYSSSTQVCGW
jgi:hypothetical protein